MKRILYSGAVSPHKGVHVLLDAFALVARESPDVHLDIVGPLENDPIEEKFDLKDVKTIRSVTPLYTSSRWSSLKSLLARWVSANQATLVISKRNWLQILPER